MPESKHPPYKLAENEPVSAAGRVVASKHPDDTAELLLKLTGQLAVTEQRLRDLVEPGSKMRRGLLGTATRDIEKQDDAYWRQFDAALTAARELLGPSKAGTRKGETSGPSQSCTSLTCTSGPTSSGSRPKSGTLRLRTSWTMCESTPLTTS